MDKRGRTPGDAEEAAAAAPPDAKRVRRDAISAPGGLTGDAAAVENAAVLEASTSEAPPLAAAASTGPSPLAHIITSNQARRTRGLGARAPSEIPSRPHDQDLGKEGDSSKPTASSLALPPPPSTALSFSDLLPKPTTPTPDAQPTAPKPALSATLSEFISLLSKTPPSGSVFARPTPAPAPAAAAAAPAGGSLGNLFARRRSGEQAPTNTQLATEGAPIAPDDRPDTDDNAKPSKDSAAGSAAGGGGDAFKAGDGKGREDGEVSYVASSFCADPNLAAAKGKFSSDTEAEIGTLKRVSALIFENGAWKSMAIGEGTVLRSRDASERKARSGEASGKVEGAEDATSSAAPAPAAAAESDTKGADGGDAPASSSSRYARFVVSTEGTMRQLLCVYVLPDVAVKSSAAAPLRVDFGGLVEQAEAPAGAAASANASAGADGKASGAGEAKDGAEGGDVAMGKGPRLVARRVCVRVKDVVAQRTLHAALEAAQAYVAKGEIRTIDVEAATTTDAAGAGTADAKIALTAAAAGEGEKEKPTATNADADAGGKGEVVKEGAGGGEAAKSGGDAGTADAKGAEQDGADDADEGGGGSGGSGADEGATGESGGDGEGKKGRGGRGGRVRGRGRGRGRGKA